MLGSNLCQNISSSEAFHNFPQSPKADSGVLPRLGHNYPSIRSYIVRNIDGCNHATCEMVPDTSDKKVYTFYYYVHWMSSGEMQTLKDLRAWPSAMCRHVLLELLLFVPYLQHPDSCTTALLALGAPQVSEQTTMLCLLCDIHRRWHSVSYNYCSIQVVQILINPRYLIFVSFVGNIWKNI